MYAVVEKLLHFVSRVHRLQTPEMGLKGWALSMIFHVRVKLIFCSFKFQMCWLSVVDDLYSIFVIDVVCSWALFLNSLAVIPT